MAQQGGAKTYQRAFDNFASQRNYALEHLPIKHSWVLHLDADEEVIPALKDEIARVVQQGAFPAYRIASKMMFMGKWLRYSGLYPSYQVRLGRIDKLRFKQVGHGQRETLAAEEIGTLKQPYLHHGFSKGLEDWKERHDRYSTDEAKASLDELKKGKVDWAGLFSLKETTRRRRALKQLSVRLPFRTQFRFLYMYFFRLGFLDGRAGFAYCRLLATYESWIVLKMRELRGS